MEKSVRSRSLQKNIIVRTEIIAKITVIITAKIALLIIK